MAVPIPQVLVVGLGNLPFPRTRHSVGQLIIDALASRFGIHMSSNRVGSFGRANVHLGETLVSLHLFKSKSLMNVSGPSIASTFRQMSRDPKELVVISDSLDHDAFILHTRLGGSANGHNGVKSVISALGGETAFYRFRVGIGRDGGNVADFVMGNLPSAQRLFWQEEGLDKVVEEIEGVVRKNAVR